MTPIENELRNEIEKVHNCSGQEECKTMVDTALSALLKIFEKYRLNKNCGCKGNFTSYEAVLCGKCHRIMPEQKPREVAIKKREREKS